MLARTDSPCIVFWEIMCRYSILSPYVWTISGSFSWQSTWSPIKRSEHVDPRYHMIRDYIDKGQFKIEHVSTDL